MDIDSNFFWWIEGIFGFLVLIGIQFGIKAMISRAEKRGRSVRMGKVFQRPLTVLIWILGILYFLEIFGIQIGLTLSGKYFDALRQTTVVACFAWIFFRWKKEYEHTLLTDSAKKVDHTTIRMVGRLITIAIGIITLLIILQIFGISTAPLLTFGSIGAASIGFASKDVIANFCSGIMLQIARPFVIGDHIFLPEKSLEGHVEEVGWFKTSIRDIEKRAVYLPNNFFSTLILINISRMSHRHFKKTLKLNFADISKISEATEKIRHFLDESPTIDSEYPLHVYIKSFDDASCVLEIEAFSTLTDSSAFNLLQHSLLLHIETILSDLDISLSHPQILVKQI